MLKRNKLKLILISCFTVLLFASSCSDNDSPIGPDEPSTNIASDTYGCITNTNGDPIEGVVVSDGFTCVTTNAEGNYEFDRNAEAEFVTYSIPSKYEIPMDKTYKLPEFFSKLVKEKEAYNLTLVELDKIETNFNLIAIGDPQINEATHAVRLKAETCKDIKEYAAASSTPCYGICLGDYVNNKWDLFSNMVVAFQPQTIGIPVFNTIGNHDYEFPKDTRKEGREKYTEFFGPTNYSLNRGNVHIVSMDDVIHGCASSTDYSGGFLDSQYEWLKQDLSYVPKDKMVILAVHIPFRDSDAPYNKEILELLSTYSYATILSGHTHSNINYIHNINGKEIFEHITGTTCGAWWHSTVCTEGAPIGFGIYSIAGTTIDNWIYKSSKHESNFQIRLYRGSDKFTGGGDGARYFSKNGANQIVANIWNWDPTWTINVYENGVKTGEMTGMNGTDAYTVAYYVDVLNLTSTNYIKSTDHLFYYTLNDESATVKVEAIDRFGNVFTQTEFTDPDDNPGTFHLNY